MTSSNLLINLALLSKQPTGLTTYAANLIPQLSVLNPTLLLPGTATDYPAFQQQHIQTVPTNLNSDYGAVGHLRRLIWTQFRLPIHYQQSQARLLFTPIPEAPIRSSCRSIITVHDLIPLRFPSRFSPLTQYWRYYVPYVLRQAQHIICDSASTAADLSQFFDISARQMTTIPLAYDNQNFRPLNLPTQNYFLYLGRHNPYKNVQRIITAFAQLSADDEIELWLAGPWDRRYTPSLQQQVQALNLTGRVKFLNYVTYQDIPKLLNQALALVFTTLWEGFGLPVLEAMACGTPVITSNLSSLPEVAGEAALLVNPYHLEALTDAMRQVANQASLRQQLSMAGLARARLFSWAKTGQATAEVLKRFL